MLVEWKRDQDFTKEALGSEYADFDLVMANGLGMPTEQSRITALFAELIEKNDLPKVVFHSLRHSSITYKLKLNGGDICLLFKLCSILTQINDICTNKLKIPHSLHP